MLSSAARAAWNRLDLELRDMGFSINVGPGTALCSALDDGKIADKSWFQALAFDDVALRLKYFCGMT